jgi:glycosyltransferase involved in cell wall biosynthesis
VAVDELSDQLRRVLEALQVIYDEEPENRRRLYELRESEDYQLAYTEDEPLVSILLPTYESHGTLGERAIPSVLAQTYENWELIVIGDAAPPETEQVIAKFREPRIRYRNLPLRGPYPKNPREAWFVTAAPPLNAGRRAARGRWLSPFSDDDALAPHAIETVLQAVKANRYELCYGLVNYLDRDTGPRPFGEFPPREYHVALQGALVHAGLRFFEHELADAIFRRPSDWSWLRRMMRAGVRIGFVDQILADYYPSYRAPSS